MRKSFEWVELSVLTSPISSYYPLQQEHLEHLGRMYAEGFADLSGPFEEDGDIRGITVYNVPTLKIADSLANLDPMVKAGRLKIEMHPWWCAKGQSLR